MGFQIVPKQIYIAHVRQVGMLPPRPRLLRVSAVTVVHSFPRLAVRLLPRARRVAILVDAHGRVAVLVGRAVVIDPILILPHERPQIGDLSYCILCYIMCGIVGW